MKKILLILLSFFSVWKGLNAQNCVGAYIISPSMQATYDSTKSIRGEGMAYIHFKFMLENDVELNKENNTFFSFNFSNLTNPTINGLVEAYGPFNEDYTACADLSEKQIYGASFSRNASQNFNTNVLPTEEFNTIYGKKFYFLRIAFDDIRAILNFVVPNTAGVFIHEPEIDCQNCLPLFNPVKGKYLLSLWTKEAGTVPLDKTTYTYPKVRINTSPSQGLFSPKGPIIDGWQKIEEIVEVYTDGDFEVELICQTGSCLFDDIRVFPFDANMQTTVYDYQNLRISAQLDDRNYATIYEYDEEGKLIRVKKETERGIMTIQETRENLFKKND